MSHAPVNFDLSAAVVPRPRSGAAGLARRPEPGVVSSPRATVTQLLTLVAPVFDRLKLQGQEQGQEQGQGQ